MLGQGLSQIFSRLSLTSTGWTLRSSTKVHLEGTHQSPIASIGEGCDYQAGLTALVLEAVQPRTVDHADLYLEAFNLLDSTGLLVASVVAQLGDPLEDGSVS